MNKFKIVTGLVIVMMIGAIIKAAVYVKPNISKEESMQIIIDIHVYGKEENREKIRMPKSTFYLNNKSRIGTFKHNFLSYIDVKEDEVDEDQLNLFLELLFKKINSVDVKVGESIEKESIATFDIFAKPYNIKEIVDKSINDVKGSKDSLDIDKYNYELMEACIGNLSLLKEDEEYVMLNVTLSKSDGYYYYTDIEEVLMIMSCILSLDE